MAAELEQQKGTNLLRKMDILNKMKALTETTEDTGKIYNEFKQLQQEFNDIKLVPAGKVNELWKTYQTYTEKFYDIVKLNNEFREYDFKKIWNKRHICVRLLKNWLKSRMSSQHSTNCKNYIRNSVASVRLPKIYVKAYGPDSRRHLLL